MKKENLKIKIHKNKTSVRKCKSKSNARFSLPYYIIKIVSVILINQDYILK